MTKLAPVFDPAGHWSRLVKRDGNTDRRPHGPPTLRWTSPTKPGGSRRPGRLSVAAVELLLGMARDAGVPDGELAVEIYAGNGEDAGKIALRPCPWRGKADPGAVKLMSLTNSRGMMIAATCIAELQPRGWTVLERHGEYLVGKLGIVNPPRRKGGVGRKK